MKIKNQEFKVLENGDVEAIQKYDGKPVIQAVDGEDIVLGDQPAYTISNIIHKGKIPYLIKFLTQQRSEFKKRIDSAEEVIAKLEHIDLKVLADAMKSLPKDIKGKKLQALDRVAQDYYMKQGAIDNLQIIQDNFDLFDKQLDFFTKLV